MKLKCIKNSLIREYPNTFDTSIVSQRHVYKEGKVYVMFAGKPYGHATKGYSQCVVHDTLGASDIACLQVILSFNKPLKRVQYERQLLKLIATHENALTLRDLTRMLHVSFAWLEWVLGFVIEFEGKTLAANAYALSKLKLSWDQIPKELVDKLHYHPTIFVPKVLEYRQELRKKPGVVKKPKVKQ